MHIAKFKKVHTISVMKKRMYRVLLIKPGNVIYTVRNYILYNSIYNLYVNKLPKCHEIN